LKAGKILPFQKVFPNGASNFKTTRETEQSPIAFSILRDTSDYADGYILVDDGISQNSYDLGVIAFTFWKIRYAEKSINFWVQNGDFNYTPPADQMVDHLDEINIYDAADLNDTNFACFLGTTINPVNLTINYNPYTKTLTLKPTS
jgi:hypothetical protein